MLLLGLMTEDLATEIEQEVRQLSREEAMAKIMSHVDRSRMLDLAQDEDGLTKWAGLAC